MSTTTYHVIACIDGRFDVMGDTADPNETVGQVAERAYNGLPYRVVPAEDPTGLGGASTPPVCPIHHAPVVWVDRNGGFWSCHKRNPDGSWCSYRAPQNHYR
jgi:hypothetical protein